MVALTAERRTPFQIRPIERPLNRFLPAVDKMKSNVMQTIRRTGDALAQRIHRSHVEDSARLHEARATIATQIHKPSVPKVLLHGAAEAAKNSAPAMIVGAGARVALGTALGAQALTVAAGASAVSRGVREATFTIRKGTYAETTKHISKHEEASTLKNFNGTTREAHTSIRAQQDRFAQTGVGKVVNAVLHGGEKKIAEFAYGKQRHARALVQAQELDIRSLTDKELIALRQHAVMARMTHGTAADVYAMRQLAKTTYQAVNAELRNNRSIKPQEAHELQLRLYKRDVRRGAVLNVVGQGVLAAAKAVPKTIGTFFAVEDIMRVLHITSHRHNPLEGLDQSMLGHAVQNAKASVSNVDLKQKFAHVGDNAIAWIGKVIAPKSVAYADELMPDTSTAVQTAASNVRHATRAVHASASTSDWTHGAGVQATRDPRITEHTEIVNGKTMVSGSGVLASESPKPMGVPGVPDPAPLAVEVDKRDVAHAVVQVQEHVATPQVVTTIVHEQIGGKTSLTQDIFDRKLIPGMESAPDAVTWYGQSGTAAQMMQHIIIPNSDKLTPDQITQLQEYVNAHPDASFGALWHANRNVFTGGMDTWTMGTGYNVAVDHVVNQQDTLAAAQIARVEQVDNAGSGRVPGHAMIAINNTAKAVQAPPQPVTRHGVPIQQITIGNGSNQNTTGAIGTTLSVTRNGIPVQQISANGAPSTIRNGLSVQALGGSPGTNTNLPDGQIPVQRITIDVSTSGFPNNIATQNITSGQDVIGSVHTSGGIPVQNISIDSVHNSAQNAGINTQGISVPRPVGRIPVQNISIDSSAQQVLDYGQGHYVVPLYEYWNGQNGDADVIGVTATYDPRFDLPESRITWDKVIFKRDTITDPHLPANDMLCAPGPNSSTFCAAHSGTNTDGFLPEEWMRRHYQVADAVDQLRSDTFTSRAQILEKAANEAREGYTREFDIHGTNVLYKLVDTRFITNEEEALFTGSPTMISMSESGALITHFCTHGSLRAWDEFDSVYRSLQETGGTIPTDVQEAYATMHRQASEAEIDHAAGIVKEFLKNNFPDRYATFIKWYKLAITADEQRQGALVQKWMPVTN